MKYRLQARQLGVWMNGVRVGTWGLTRGIQTFSYDADWLNVPETRPLSLSMPLIPASECYSDQRVEAFFDNLLPDSQQIRARLQRNFKTSSTKAFDLLEQVGADCVGAIQLLPDNRLPKNVRTIEGEPLSEADVERIIVHTVSAPFGQLHDDEVDFRISLAGAQEKTAMLWHNNQWHRPIGTTPTTHIIKLPIGNFPQGIDLSTSVENEWLCAQLLRAYGIPIASCSIQQFGSQKVLVVTRFDRVLSIDQLWWIRLPQEDFCQATATPSGQKYENDGGPGILKCLNLLLGSSVGYQDRIDFLRTQILFWMLCAIDGHAKNFSIFLEAGGNYRLTPRYDVLSAYPVLASEGSSLSRQKIKMAMAVEGKNRHYHWDTIQSRHWIETGRQAKLEEETCHLIQELMQKTPEVVSQVSQQLPEDFPAWISDSIFDGLTKAAERLATV